MTLTKEGRPFWFSSHSDLLFRCNQQANLAPRGQSPLPPRATESVFLKEIFGVVKEAANISQKLVANKRMDTDPTLSNDTNQDSLLKKCPSFRDAKKQKREKKIFGRSPFSSFSCFEIEKDLSAISAVPVPAIFWHSLPLTRTGTTKTRLQASQWVKTKGFLVFALGS